MTSAIDKKSLSERDICTKFISPAIERAGWDMQNQLREEVYITKGPRRPVATDARGIKTRSCSRTSRSTS